MKPRRGPAVVGRWASLATALALVFLVLSLLSLIFIPPHLDREVRTVRDSIQQVLMPAGELASQVELSQVRQMAALQAFLLSGSARFRQGYRDARQEEERAFDSLSVLTEDMDLSVRQEMARLASLSLSWHLGHQDILTQESLGEGAPPRVLEGDYLSRITREQELYEEVLAATSDLKGALDMQRERGESARTRARYDQDRITRALVLLGLFATVVVMLLGWHLRKLMTQAEARRQEALRARREADALLGATGDGVVGMDMEGRCTFLNRSGAELLGYSTRLAVGRDVHDLLHHSHADGRPFSRDECPVLRALHAGEPIYGLNETLWRAGREPFPVQLSLRALKDGREVKGAVLTFADMTEPQAVQESLRRAVQARDEVMAVVSHDLRNPVATVYSAASLLLEVDLTPEKRREHHQAIKSSARRMNRLIQDLLDVTRLEAGALPVVPAPFTPRDLVEEVLRAYRAQAEESGIVLEATVREPAPLGWGDRHRLVQVLTNLVENALRYTPPGGSVVLTAEVGGDGEGLLFTVADTGPGIRPEDQERLFDRFWQVSRKDKRGAGLGLAIAKGIVEAHGGEIGVESAQGAGSTFWFSLPGKEARAE